MFTVINEEEAKRRLDEGSMTFEEYREMLQGKPVGGAYLTGIGINYGIAKEPQKRMNYQQIQSMVKRRK